MEKALKLAFSVDQRRGRAAQWLYCVEFETTPDMRETERERESERERERERGSGRERGRGRGRGQYQQRQIDLKHCFTQHRAGARAVLSC